jgi:CheY-like chemotaxis protein
MSIDISRVNVILADDEITNRVVASMNLGMCGFEEDRINECEDGEEAMSILTDLQTAEDDNDAPVIVLLDLHMPGGMDGNIAALKIRETMNKFTTRKPFLVCCSAEVIEQLKERPWASAFHYFAAKPLLESVIQEMFDECNKTYG